MWVHVLILISANIFKASSKEPTSLSFISDDDNFYEANSNHGTTNILYGSEGTITCGIRSPTPMHILWYFADETTGQFKKIVPSDKYWISADGTQLTIKKMDLDLVGKYICEAAHSQRIRIVLTTPKVTGKMDKSIVNGSNVNIECKIIEGWPMPNITWQFMNKYGSKFTSIAGSENVLCISNVEDKHAGRYKCIAENIAGRDEHVTTLTVEFPPRIISNPSMVYEGIKGDIALRIPCVAVSVPQPVITWKIKGAKIIHNEKYSIEDGALVIMNPNEADSTSYTCEAKNYIGSVSATFEAKVKQSLNSLGLKHHVYLLEGETRKLQCEEFNSKSQSVRWFVEDVEVNTVPYIQVADATVSDDGNYTCRVSDKHGHTHTHTYVVDVGRPPTLLEQSPVDDWRGDVYDILSSCETYAKPLADVEFKFNGIKLTSRDLTEVGMSIAWGNYTCTATNVHGSVQRSFEVKSSVCLIPKHIEDEQNMPLLLTNGLNWPKWETTKHYLIVEGGEEFALSCPNCEEAPNAFQKFPKQSELKVFCNKQDTFLVDGKPYKLSDLHCSNGIRPTIVRKKVKCLTDTSELIKVGYNAAGFLETYEVCFDHAKNMPMYTRVLMTSIDRSLNAAHNWHKYPGIGDGKRDRGFTCKNTSSTCCYSKSQLVNARDFEYGSAKYTTYIDPLNAIPVWRPCEYFEKTNWEDIGDMARRLLVRYDEFVAWSGTHTLQEKHGAVIPRYLWKVLRFDEDESVAIVHVNDPSPTWKDIRCGNKCMNYEISWFRGSEYTYCCELSEFLEAFDLRDTDIGESLDVALGKIESNIK